MRAEERTDLSDLQSLPTGSVTLVFSRYCEVETGGVTWLCQVRKTLSKVNKGDIVVGDNVKFRDMGIRSETGQPEGMIEQILPRTTVLTRADSFKQIVSHPIVANAQQMLIVTSVREPDVKWGLIDRMIVAALSGGLVPIVCLNKSDLLPSDAASELREEADSVQVLNYYKSIEIQTLLSSVESNQGIEELRNILKNRITVLAGHSGVGKSSLIQTIQPDLDLRIGAISGYTGKGRHTTTSARRYNLKIGGQVIDTPGVKLFGLWGVTRGNLSEYFPDVADGTAPEWRQESYQRIESSLAEA
jgi:ribosome biogenesis GTPase